MPFLKETTKETLNHLLDRIAQKNGLRHTIYFPNGDKYTGEWLHDKKHGKGTEVYKKTGAIYDGDWKDGKRNGFGTFSTLQRASKEHVKVYSGGWKNDKKDGYGTYLYSESVYYEAGGNRYEGTWKDGMKHGPGKFFFPDKGQLYEGVWAQDIAKCGTLVDSGRGEASDPTTYPIPKVCLTDVQSVLMEAQSHLKERE
ncbi:hypothetical protein AAFF_G00023110 [Aldrovandia affinis]|uniref:MORN repeat-containing protein 3 n=1 Tax=Aldrovandia affinis TaxID=143900 RepID=A0AAD7T5V1_9TELE|nr:hypothetical protein AAFF_G00023110 [Aldrovandia affinis]